MEATEKEADNQKQRCRAVEPSTVELAAFLVDGYRLFKVGSETLPTYKGGVVKRYPPSYNQSKQGRREKILLHSHGKCAVLFYCKKSKTERMLR